MGFEHTLAGFAQQVWGGVQQQAPWLQAQGRWVSELTGAALRRWGPVAASGALCQIAPGSPNGPGKACGLSAAGHCIGCQSATCCDHAFARNNGDVVCFACISTRVAGGRRMPPPRPQPAPGPGPGPPPPQPPPRVDPAKLMAAHETLGMPEGSSFEAVTKAWKKLAAQNHPDRFQRPADKQRQEAVLKELNSAYELIKECHQS